MLRLKTSLSLLLIICLNVGCDKVILPSLKNQERCVISLEHKICRCHMYQIADAGVGRVSDSYNNPLKYCDKLVGFSPDSWIELVLWLEEVFDTVKDANDK